MSKNEKNIEDILEETLDDLPREELLNAAETLAQDTEKEAFQEAVDEAAEQRARTPFEVAATQHMRLYQPFINELDSISGGAAKRILRYLVGYPFFVEGLNPQNKQVETLGYMADKLVQMKFTMTLCQAMEQEAKAMQTLAEHAAIEKLDLEGKNDSDKEQGE